MQLFRSRVLLWHSINYSWLFLCYRRSESISRFISSFYSGSCSSNPVFLCVLLITHVWNNGVTLCLIGIHMGVEKRICQRGEILPSLFLLRRLLSSWRCNEANPQWNTSEIQTPSPAVGIILLSIPCPLIFCIFLVSWTKTQTASFPPAPPTISEGVPCFFFSCDTAKPTATSKKSAELPKLAAVERKGGMPRLLWYSRKAGKFSPSG